MCKVALLPLRGSAAVPAWLLSQWQSLRRLGSTGRSEATCASTQTSARPSTPLRAADTGFSVWKRFFPSDAQSVATVDRLIDNATVLRFSGKIFRSRKEIIGESDE